MTRWCVSCNAYFAQLAVTLGSDSLARTAAAAGITLNVSTTAAGAVRANLPHAGYGQGEVVATPMRLARVAAAIGTDGVIRETSIVLPRPESLPSPYNPARGCRSRRRQDDRNVVS
jgi:cell division protein FtsI/penicillin-binding protein 2